MRKDIGYALRMLRQAPGFTAVVVATLALGIGGTIAVFSVLQAVLLAPLPYEQPGQLVRLYQQYPDDPSSRGSISGPHVMALRDEVTSFEDLTGVFTYRETELDLVRGGRAERLRVLRVTSDYFRTLRSGSLRGPGFNRDDEVGSGPTTETGCSRTPWRRSCRPSGFSRPCETRSQPWTPNSLCTTSRGWQRSSIEM